MLDLETTRSGDMVPIITELLSRSAALTFMMNATAGSSGTATAAPGSRCRCSPTCAA